MEKKRYLEQVRIEIIHYQILTVIFLAQIFHFAQHLPLRINLIQYT